MLIVDLRSEMKTYMEYLEVLFGAKYTWNPSVDHLLDSRCVQS